jgi:hypothetical protein
VGTLKLLKEASEGFEETLKKRQSAVDETPAWNICVITLGGSKPENKIKNRTGSNHSHDAWLITKSRLRNTYFWTFRESPFRVIM